jgi:[citrate (pro-3S)-lyase] ligase
MMSDYYVSFIRPDDRRGTEAVNALLLKAGIRRDANLDYTCAVYDDDKVIATGSLFGNTMRCFAVDPDYQGEGLMNTVVTHLIDVQFSRGNTHFFIYTKISSAKFFADLGFYEIARVDGSLVFMENRKDGFASYLKSLEEKRASGRSAALVMNANPFTLGHRYLAETAAAGCDTLHLFVLSEDKSLVPFAVRKKLVQEGVADIPNIVLHDSGPYIISGATFPSYFMKDEAAVVEGHARLDLSVFAKIASALNITRRFVGSETRSETTAIYNRVMLKELPKAGIECVGVPRLESGGQPISASTVRQGLKAGDWTLMRSRVPETTLRFFQSDEAQGVLERIRSAGDVVHH